MPNEQEVIDPLSLNLYTYCGNNPVLYQDANGHAFVVAAILIGIVVGALAGGVYSLIKNGYVRWQNIAIGATIGGLLGLAVGIGGALLFGNGIAASTAKVMSGFVGVVVYGHQQITSGIRGLWELAATQRGWLIENFLGGMGHNFPVIDKFARGINSIASFISSIKSMNLLAKSYQSATTIYNKVMRFGWDLYNFTQKTYMGTTVVADATTKRVLELAIPAGATLSQIRAIHGVC